MVLLPLAILFQAGSGVQWDSLYSGRERDGTGPPNIIFQLSTRKNGRSGYRVCVFEDENERHLLSVKNFPDRVRFHYLTPHQTILNDYYEEKGQWHKVFPEVVFVAHGQASGKPVTYVWSAHDDDDRKPVLLLRVFDGDARHLDGVEHGSKERGNFLIERARASWLPPKDRPSWARPSDRLVRRWIYLQSYESGKGPFQTGPWHRIR